jgi:LuxR family transcriptional regulator, maltose regulon positive regulatory protein
MTSAPVSDALGPVTPLPLAKAKHPSMSSLVAGIVPTGRRTWSSTAPIGRPHLLERLVISDEPLVVVSAPAGYGKTTLLHQWAAIDDRPFAWVRLSADDRDPDLLAEHVTRALLMAGVLSDGRVKPSVTLARRVGGTPQIELAAAVSISGPVVIALDDAQELQGEPALAMLEALLDQLTEGSQLVVAGRVKPALRLAHLRAENKLREVGADDLALEPQESAGLVEAAGLHLTAKGAAALVEQAEGWPAGLTLAARSLRGRRDPELAARHFGGDDRAVADYLAEVIDGLGQGAIDFLLETSVLERFCAGLCDAVRKRHDSSQVLEALEKANLFIVPMDHTGDWYRYHHLFASFLRSERRRRLGDDDALLHARASRWWEQHDGRDSAVRHAFASGDLDRFEMLVWSATPLYLNNEHLGDLVAWLSLPSAEQVVARPSIALATAWLTVALDAGPPGPLIANLTDGPDAVLSDGTPVRAALALLRSTDVKRDPTRALTDAADAYDALEGHNPWKAFACLSLGRALRLLGRPHQAEAALQEGHDRSALTMPALAASCLVQLAWAAMEERDWGQAESSTSRARAALASAGASRPIDRFAINATSAFLLARSGDTAASHNYAQAALNTVPDGDGQGATTIEAQVILARALVLLSDHASARELLWEARARLARLPGTGTLAEKASEAEDVVTAAFAASPIPDPLSPAEMRVLRYLPTYMTFEEISRELIVSRTTVKTQAIAVYRKLGVKSRAEAVRKAQQQGLLSA